MRKRRRMPNDDALEFGERERVRMRAFRDDGVFVRRDHWRMRVGVLAYGPPIICAAALAAVALWAVLS